MDRDVLVDNFGATTGRPDADESPRPRQARRGSEAPCNGT